MFSEVETWLGVLPTSPQPTRETVLRAVEFLLGAASMPTTRPPPELVVLCAERCIAFALRSEALRCLTTVAVLQQHGAPITGLGAFRASLVRAQLDAEAFLIAASQAQQQQQGGAGAVSAPSPANGPTAKAPTADAIVSAITSLVQGLDAAFASAKKSPKMAIYVNNAAVLWWRMARPLMGPEGRPSLIPTLKSLCRAVDECCEANFTLRARLHMLLARAFDDTRQWNDAIAAAQQAFQSSLKVREQAAAAAPAGAPSATGVAVPAQAAQPAPAAAGAGASPPSASLRAEAMRLYAHVCRTNAEALNKLRSDIFSSAGFKDLRAGFLVQTILSGVSKEAKALVDAKEALGLAVKGDDAMVAEIAWAAVRAGAPSVAKECLTRLTLSRNAKARAVAEIAQCELWLHEVSERRERERPGSSRCIGAGDTPDARQYHNVLSQLSSTLELCVRQLQQQVQGRGRDEHPAWGALVEEASSLVWRASVPLARDHHRTAKKALQRASGALATAASANNLLQARIHAELAHCELRDDTLAQALAHAEKAIALCPGASLAQDLRALIGRLKLRMNIYGDTSICSLLERAYLGIERARELRMMAAKSPRGSIDGGEGGKTLQKTQQQQLQGRYGGTGNDFSKELLADAANALESAPQEASRERAVLLHDLCLECAAVGARDVHMRVYRMWCACDWGEVAGAAVPGCCAIAAPSVVGSQVQLAQVSSGSSSGSVQALAGQQPQSQQSQAQPASARGMMSARGKKKPEDPEAAVVSAAAAAAAASQGAVIAAVSRLGADVHYSFARLTLEANPPEARATSFTSEQMDALAAVQSGLRCATAAKDVALVSNGIAIVWNACLGMARSGEWDAVRDPLLNCYHAIEDASRFAEVDSEAAGLVCVALLRSVLETPRVRGCKVSLTAQELHIAEDLCKFALAASIPRIDKKEVVVLWNRLQRSRTGTGQGSSSGGTSFSLPKPCDDRLQAIVIIENLAAEAIEGKRREMLQRALSLVEPNCEVSDVDILAKIALEALALHDFETASRAVSVGIALVDHSRATKDQLRWLAVCKCVQGQSMMRDATMAEAPVISVTNAQVLLQAAGVFAEACQHSARAGEAKLLEHSVRLFWNVCLAVSKCVFMRKFVHPMLQSVVDSVVRAGCTLYTVLLQMFNLLLECLEAEGQYEEGIALIEGAFKRMPKYFHGPLWRMKITFLCGAGSDSISPAALGMTKESAMLQAQLYVTLAQSSAKIQDQQLWYDRALKTLAKHSLARGEVALECASWMATVGKPCKMIRSLLRDASVRIGGTKTTTTTMSLAKLDGSTSARSSMSRLKRRDSCESFMSLWTAVKSETGKRDSQLSMSSSGDGNHFGRDSIQYWAILSRLSLASALFATISTDHMLSAFDSIMNIWRVMLGQSLPVLLTDWASVATDQLAALIPSGTITQENFPQCAAMVWHLRELISELMNSGYHMHCLPLHHLVEILVNQVLVIELAPSLIEAIRKRNELAKCLLLADMGMTAEYTKARAAMKSPLPSPDTLAELKRQQREKEALEQLAESVGQHGATNAAAFESRRRPISRQAFYARNIMAAVAQTRKSRSLSSVSIVLECAHQPSTEEEWAETARLLIREGQYTPAKRLLGEALSLATAQENRTVFGTVFHLLSLVADHEQFPDYALQLEREAQAEGGTPEFWRDSAAHVSDLALRGLADSAGDPLAAMREAEAALARADEHLVGAPPGVLRRLSRCRADLQLLTAERSAEQGGLADRGGLGDDDASRLGSATGAPPPAPGNCTPEEGRRTDVLEVAESAIAVLKLSAGAPHLLASVMRYSRLLQSQAASLDPEALADALKRAHDTLLQAMDVATAALSSAAPGGAAVATGDMSLPLARLLAAAHVEIGDVECEMWRVSGKFKAKESELNPVQRYLAAAERPTIPTGFL